MKPADKAQELCTSCGICCDNTLFDVVIQQDGDPHMEKWSAQETLEDGKAYFRLPCPYFAGCCSIYDQDKPRRCSEFKCSLLKKMNANEISKVQALKTVRDILKARNEIIREYAAVTGETKTFLQIYRELALTEAEVDAMPIELKTVHFKSNLLHVQLARWFRAPEEFEKYVHSMS
jgi:hypothetical protein